MCLSKLCKFRKGSSNEKKIKEGIGYKVYPYIREFDEGTYAIPNMGMDQRTERWINEKYLKFRFENEYYRRCLTMLHGECQNCGRNAWLNTNYLCSKCTSKEVAQNSTSNNTGIMQFDCDKCTNASRCPIYRNGMRVLNCGFVELHNA